MYKWMGITFGLGLLLAALEYYVATKKKEGFTATDKKRVLGILWLSAFFAALVGSLIWMSPD